ncbi:MAG TPA: TolC family protein [Gemmatimonadaceae bacterium]|nr:TolC family protein [Gemmatimonadaceae bacterium]
MNRVLAFFALGLAAVTPAAGQAVRSDTVRYSVAEAVDHALHASDEVKLSRLTLAQSDAQFGAARASAVPQIRFNGSYSQVIQNARATIVGSVFGQSYTYQGTFVASQTLFQGGRIMWGSRSASRLRDASEFDAGEARARLAVDMQRAYLNAVYLGRLVELQERNLALSTERLQQVEQLLAAGRSSRYDLLRARVARANIEPLVLQARNDRENALLDLKRLLDVDMYRPLALTTTLDTASVRMVVNAVIADAAPDAVRGSVQSAELTLLARQDGVRVARAALFPTVSATFNYGYLGLPTKNGLPDRFGATSGAYCDPPSTTKVCQNNGFFADRSFGVQVSWAVFDGLLTKSNIELASVQRSIAETNLHQQREAAALDLARARAEFDRARAAWDARGQNSAEAEESYNLAALRFTRGLGTQLDVTDAQFAMLTAQANEARALVDVYLAAADLARVRGRPIPLPTGALLSVRSSSGISSRDPNTP